MYKGKDVRDQRGAEYLGLGKGLTEQEEEVEEDWTRRVCCGGLQLSGNEHSRDTVSHPQ